jgi:hypothetical protein
MNSFLRDQITAVGGDPRDERWNWFATRGPHGSSFTWSASRSNPRGYVGLEHLEGVIAELMRADAAFLGWLRRAARAVLGTCAANDEFLRRAIQILAVVGEPGDISLIRIPPYPHPYRMGRCSVRLPWPEDI